MWVSKQESYLPLAKIKYWCENVSSPFLGERLQEINVCLHPFIRLAARYFLVGAFMGRESVWGSCFFVLFSLTVLAVFCNYNSTTAILPVPYYFK